MKLINKLAGTISKKLYWPICRGCARRLGDNPADKIYTTLCSLAFYQIHHYWPNLRCPRTFSEKIFYRMLFDRRSILTTLSDKLLVRKYVSNKIGEKYLIPLLWTGEKPEEIPFASLPNEFVIKTNHGCGFTIINNGMNYFDPNKALKVINLWLKKNFCLDFYLGHAWAYKNITPRIMIEEYLEEENKPPKDYKFFCFSGRVEYLLIVYDRFGYHREKHFTKEFVPLDLWNGSDQFPGPFSRPINYDEMIRIAEKLSTGFDFVRVDLYNIKGKIYFGELTFYPAAGLAPFVPRSWDYIFGEKWKLQIK